MKLNLKSYLKLGASLIAFLAFFMLFMPAITYSTGDVPQRLEWNEIYLGEYMGRPVILPMIGFVLFLVGSLIMAYTTVQPTQNEVVVTALPIFLLIVGVVFVLLTRICFNAVMDISGVEEFKEQYSIGIGPIIGGVLGIISILLCIVGEYIVGD